MRDREREYKRGMRDREREYKRGMRDREREYKRGMRDREREYKRGMRDREREYKRGMRDYLSITRNTSINLGGTRVSHSSVYRSIYLIKERNERQKKREGERGEYESVCV